MQRTAIIKQLAASKRLNFLIKQGQNLIHTKPRNIMDPNSMHNYTNIGKVVPAKLLKKLSIPEISNLIQIKKIKKDGLYLRSKTLS